jgi:beta-catenin-like protein 1
MLLFWVQEEEAIALVEAMLDANALELLVQVHQTFAPAAQCRCAVRVTEHARTLLARALQRLTSLDESNDDEAAAVHHMLAIFENMIEVKPEVAEMVVENTKVADTPGTSLHCMACTLRYRHALHMHRLQEHQPAKLVLDQNADQLLMQLAQLLRWILGKVKQRGGEVDSNKQYTSELLAILMQHSEKNQARLGEANGIDTILQAIAYYKNR